jgi:hypothetical protein
VSMELSDAVRKALTSVTRDFLREKRKAAAAARDYLSSSQIERLQKKRDKNIIKQAAYEVMKDAYMLASDNGTLPANARQIMYAARPLVLEKTGGKCWKNSDYFTQTLLPDYQADHPEENWNVVYDARGHLAEPHIEKSLGLGTLDVRGYVGSWTSDNPADDLKIDLDGLALCPTCGPHNRYKFALFIEKEGFDPLLERSRISEKYDTAIFSSKGMSVTAARQLIEKLSQAGVTILVVHDFDISGLVILQTLGHDTRRYQFQVQPNVIGLGLRLADVKRMKLQSEPVIYEQHKDPREKFREYEDCDVSQTELDYLVEGRKSPKEWYGKRVELNTMTSRQFVSWLEAKFKAHGVKKVVPDPQVLASAWHRARKLAAIKQAIEEVKPDKSKPPTKLAKQVAALLAKQPEIAWDEAVLKLAQPDR